MQKFKLNDHGFHVLPLLLVIVVIGVVGLAGLRVFNLRHGSTTEGQAVRSTDSTGMLQTAPGGWKVYADEAIGVQFVYPEVYGSFSKQPDTGKYESLLSSGRLSTSYLPGVSGAFSLKTYSKGVMEVQPLNEGPLVKLVGNEWIVQSDESDNKVYEKGDVYLEMKRSNTHGLEVYTIEAGDEGVMTYRIYFVSGGQLRILELPPFDSEQYSTTYNINDRGPYDTMFMTVRDSIRLY